MGRAEFGAGAGFFALGQKDGWSVGALERGSVERAGRQRIDAGFDCFLGLAAGDGGVFALEQDLGESAGWRAGGEGFAAVKGAGGGATAQNEGEDSG